MAESRPERRQVQISLRRMLLWTGMAAFVLGIGRSLLGANLNFAVVFFVAWILAVSFVRSIMGRLAALAVSLGFGVAAAGYDVIVYRSPLGFTGLLWVGCIMALLVVGLSIGVCYAIDYFDRLIERKTMRRD